MNDKSKTIEEVEEKLFLQPLSAMVTKLCYFRRLERAWRLIERDFARPDMTLQEAAAVSRASKNHLNVLLRRTTGLTFHQLLVRYRILRAISMMLERNYSFLEISAEVGFGSLNTFERDFRQLMGVTPRGFKSGHLSGRIG